MKHKRILVISLLGNILEYFDYTIFAVFSIQIGKYFFSDYDQLTQVLWSLTIFGAGFITRPLGSMLFGHFGDKKGRRKTLIYTISGMAFSTLLIGILPSYNQIGIYAPIMLCLLRLCQGLFVGGEGAGAAVYVLEQNKVYNKGVIGGAIMSSNIFGATIAMIAGLVINQFTSESIAWRLLFVTGGVFGMIIILLRTSLPETAEYILVKKDAKVIRFPIVQLFQKYWRQVIISFLVGAFTSSVSYCTKAYVNVHFQQIMGYSINLSLAYSIFALFFFMTLLPVFGFFANKHGDRKFMLSFTVVVILITPIAFKLISIEFMSANLLGLFLIGSLAAGICSPIYPYMASMFPANVRYTGVAVSFNLGIAFFGGFSPLFSTLITNWTGMKSGAFLYIITLGIIYLITELIIDRTTSAKNKS
ncbi:MAG: MFS transporter [Rickettsiales bacterium]